MNYTKIIRRETKAMLAIVLVLVVMVLGVSYAFFMKVAANTNNQVVTTGTLEISYQSTNGYLSNDTYPELIPMSNEDGLNQAGYGFTVKNTGNISATYQVYLYVNEDDYNQDVTNGTISGDLFTNLSLINYNIKTNSDGNNTVYKVSDLGVKDDNGVTKYKLYEGIVASNNSTNAHLLKIWLTNDLDVSEIGKYVYLKIEVQGYVSGQEEVVALKKCRRATMLHTASCVSEEGSGCRSTMSERDTITYGNNLNDVIQGELHSGDAFDCDVNGDGIYDSENERFYYISDKYIDTTNPKENESVDNFDDKYAVLLYSNNTYNGEGNSTQTTSYSSSENGWETGPNAVKLHLPTASQWNNIALSTTSRNIADNNGTIRTSSFGYDGYAARLLTAQELNKSCGITIGLYTIGELDNCKFLMENTKYQNTNYAVGYWLESPSSSNSSYAFSVYGDYQYVNDGTISIEGGRGVRPAIEVLKTDMDY